MKKDRCYHYRMITLYRVFIVQVGVNLPADYKQDGDQEEVDLSHRRCI